MVLLIEIQTEIAIEQKKKTLPLLSKGKNHQDWLKLIRIRKNFTDLPKERQGRELQEEEEEEVQKD